jgi:hypothetical protein
MLIEDNLNIPEEGITHDFSINQPVDTPADVIIDTPVDTPADVIIDTPVDTSADVIIDTPADIVTPEELSDEKLFNVLSEKLGREVKSFDDIKQKEVELNPQIKAIAEWAEKTGRPVEDWVKFNKDYDSMSNLEKAEEILKLKYPTLTDKEIGLELSRYTEYEDDLEEEKAAKSLELKKLVAEGSNTLESNRLKFGEPVEGYKTLTPEIQEQLEFANQAKTEYEKAINNQKLYDEAIVSSVSKLDSYEIPLTEGLSIRYNLTPEDKKELPKFLSSMPHWYNEDGTHNHSKITEDALKIRNFDNLIKMAYEQGIAAGTEESIKVQNNITLDRPAVGSEQDNNNQGIVIEGNFKRSGTKVIFGKK